MSKIARLHCITTGPSHADQAARALDGGAKWIQLRDKYTPVKELTFVAREVMQICEAHDATLIINDHVELAKEVGAHGVHLGQKDMDIDAARSLLGTESIIGGTAHNTEEYQYLLDRDVDYIGLGPIRESHTKHDLSQLLGIEGAANIMSSSPASIPVIVIGGIRVSDIKGAMSIGAHGLAIASAINKESDPSGAVAQILDQIKSNRLSHV